MLSNEDIAHLAADAREREEPAPWSQAAPAATPAPATPAAELPIAEYDGLSLPSLRARLRQFSVDQLEILIAHERSSANRPDVVTMFERRIVKLNEFDGRAEQASTSR